MKYLFDTDILIYWLKGNQTIERKAVAMGLENIGYSIISHTDKLIFHSIIFYKRQYHEITNYF